jgi:hypothetical protein
VQPRRVGRAASVGGDQDDLVGMLEIQQRGAADLTGLGADALQEADGRQLPGTADPAIAAAGAGRSG